MLPQTGTVLEIASGSGQHVIHFARGLPQLTWQPSDPDPQARASVASHLADESLPNVRAPLDLDVRARPWPIGACDAILCINMIHISPWAATEALFAGAHDVLASGVMYLYGPYRVNGRHTAPSNEAFDRSLRAQDSQWGVRDLEDVLRLARDAGFELLETVQMPANNLSVVLARSTAGAVPSP